MGLDRQVQVELILKAADALKGAESLYTVLEKISKLPMGEINKALSNMKDITKELVPAAKDAASAMGQLTQQVRNFEHVNVKVAALRDEMGKLNTATTKVGESSTKAAGLFEYFAMKAKSHMAWMATGLMLGGIVAAPALFIESLAKIETGMAGMAQVNKTLHDSQAALNEETMKFIGIASMYGEEVTKIIDAGKLWGRAYKDLEVVNILTSQSAKLAIADNFDLKEATLGLEAAMAQFGMRAENATQAMDYSQRVLDVWTKVAHNAQVSAKDLAQAVERTGAVAHMTGASFEFLNALVATGVRNTARSGSEIGQTLKSMVSSIHTDKAIKEIESMGIAVYKFNQDGTKEFRNVQDVILDLAIATQTTTMNMEEMDKAISGGKFQYSKTAAILGDYKEIIRVWQEAIDSAGFTNGQVETQLDTITRKLAQMKAEMESLVVGLGNSGLSQFIKEQIAGITEFLRGLGSINADTWKTIATTAEWGIAIFALLRIMQTMVTTMGAAGVASEFWNTSIWRGTYAAAARTAATTELTAAQTALNLATGNWVPIALTVGTIIWELVRANGALATVEDKRKLQAEAEIEGTRRRVEVGKQAVGFIDSMATAYDKLTDEQSKYEQGSAQWTKIEGNKKSTIEALTKAIETNGAADTKNMELVGENGKINQNTINTVKEAHKTQGEQMAKDLQQMGINQYNAAKDMIKWANDRIEKMDDEMKALNFLQRAYLNFMDVLAARHEETAKFYDEQAQDPKKMAGLMGLAPGNDDVAATAAKGLAGQERDEATRIREARNKKYLEYVGVPQALKRADELLHDATPMITSFGNVANDGGGTVTDKAGKVKNTGSAPGSMNPVTLAESEQRFQNGEKLKALYSSQKVAADSYAEALEKINTKESIYGKTVDTIIERYGVMKNRAVELSNEEMSIVDTRELLNKQLTDEIAKRDALDATISDAYENWKSMDKDQQRAARESNAEYQQSIKTIHELDNILIETDKHMADLAKNRTGIQGQLDKSDKGNQNTDSRWKDYMSDTHLWAEQDKGQLNRSSPFYKTQSDSIDLFYAQKRKDALTEQMKQAQDDLTKAQGTGKQGAIDEATKKIKILEEETVKADKDLVALKEKLEPIKNGIADMMIQMGVHGAKFSDIWKKVWQDFATDAIKAMMKVNNASPGLLSQIFGMFGMGGGGGAAKALPQAAKGDITDGPTIAGEDGKEAVIPLEKNKGNSKSLWLQAGKMLGMGKEMAPSLSNPNVVANANESSATAQQFKQTREHIDALQQTNTLLVDQNAMILQIAKEGGSTTLMPVITQVSSEQVLKILHDNPSALSNILGKQKSSGYR